MVQAIESNITTRRSFLGTSAAAAAVLTVGVAAPTLAATPDPIYAAIENHRATYGEFSTRCFDLSDEETELAQGEWERLHNVQTDAALALCHVMPTTLAGVVALLRYSVEFVASRELFPDDFVEDGGEFKMPFSYFLERHVADAIDKITGTAASFDLTS